MVTYGEEEEEEESGLTGARERLPHERYLGCHRQMTSKYNGGENKFVLGSSFLIFFLNIYKKTSENMIRKIGRLQGALCWLSFFFF